VFARATLILLCTVASAAIAARGPHFARAQSDGDAAVSASVQSYDEGDVPWRGSVSVGAPFDGRLIRGVQLPEQGTDFFTWDFPLGRSPNRPWRRWAADRTIHPLLAVLAAYRAAHPGAPRVGIADLSRPHGGPFGRRFGGLGHASHQNGLDVDVLYPRSDFQERPPSKPSRIDHALAQALLDDFVAAGAQYVFVGPHTHLGGPRRVVQPLVYHDDHMHVRFFARGQARVRD
jgi:murein endopeptidase